MAKYKAVLFDLDGTLRHNVPSGGRVFNEYVRGLGLRISGEDELRAQRWEHFYFASSPDIHSDTDEFKDRDAFWTNFARRRLIALGCGKTQAQLLAPEVSAHMAENYKPKSHVPDEVFAMLHSLRSCEYVLGVVSNRDHPFQDELKELKLDPFFGLSLAGGEVHSFKPETRIFEHALEMAGISALETVYVGDNYFADVVGARRAGLTPVLFDPEDVFPDADCAIIKSFNEFNKLLN